jgi:hypothetical protein
MESDLKEKTTTATDSLINTETAGTLAPVASWEDSTEQVKAYANKALELLADLPEGLGRFFADYRSQLITIGLLFGSFIGVKVTLALLSALNEIPLVEPSLEIIGLGYTSWFIYRFVIKADNRQELSTKYHGFKDQILGKK